MTAAAWAWLSVVVLAALVWAAITSAFLWMRWRLPRLPGVLAELPEGTRWPKLSVIVPARDEEAEVERAMRSLLSQDYPDLEVIVVDDRSADGTGGILDRLAGEDSRLSVIHVSELPGGWLGKNHACHVAVQRAAGEWLLFTDGDIHFGPGALRRAVTFATAHGLGHLVVFPHLVAPRFGERAFVSAFSVFVSLKFRPWDLRRPGTSAYVGAGAFNLARREAYFASGGHRTLAMEVVDDIKLGLILRRSGVPQGAADSGGLVRVRWQVGLLATMRGLLKNSFAVVEWQWWMTLAGVVFMSLTSIAPALALVAAPEGWLRLLALPSVLAPMVLHALLAREIAGGLGLEGLLFPLCALLLIGVSVWSAADATLRGAISWRGTRYSLTALRAGCVREKDWPASKAVGWE